MASSGRAHSRVDWAWCNREFPNQDAISYMATVSAVQASIVLLMFPVSPSDLDILRKASGRFMFQCRC
eukprot:1234440-Amphidinium_carterae.1